jgi:hypothetical protein
MSQVKKLRFRKFEWHNKSHLNKESQSWAGAQTQVSNSSALQDGQDKETQQGPGDK